MPLSNIVNLAEKIATQAHEGQFRRGGIIPYIEHPKAVVSRVGDDQNAQVVAWLHDVIEDTDETAESLVDQGIPEELVKAVVLLTKTKESVYEEYIDAIASCEVAKAVKVADMLSNLSDKPTKKQIKKYSEGLLRLLRD